jgi:transposase
MEHDRDRTASINIQKKGYEIAVPVDGGEFKPVEMVTVDDRAKAPKKHTVDEAGIVLELPQEAPCL